MTERSDGVPDARIQAAKVIAENHSGFCSQAMSPDQGEGVFDARGAGGRWSEGIGRAAMQG